MAKRRSIKPKDDEQLELLRLILEEVRKMNSQLVAIADRSLQAATNPPIPDDGSVEELDSYE
ncbi:MAG TPA: hypothetical protein VJL54_05530 [Nitrososphaera sp.]|nr:hypothetical protein [Nitrososphaera sp.]